MIPMTKGKSGGCCIMVTSRTVHGSQSDPWDAPYCPSVQYSWIMKTAATHQSQVPTDSDLLRVKV